MRAPVNRTVLYGLVLCVVAVLAVGVNSVLYTNREVAKAEASAVASLRLMCGWVVIVDDAQQRTPPATDVGRQFAAELHRFREALHCDQQPRPGGG